MFPCEFCENFKNTFFAEYLRATTFDINHWQLWDKNIINKIFNSWNIWQSLPCITSGIEYLPIIFFCFSERAHGINGNNEAKCVCPYKIWWKWHWIVVLEKTEVTIFIKTTAEVRTRNSMCWFVKEAFENLNEALSHVAQMKNKK